jgi:pyruvate-ferredoxin/flavodoxin oxidoreductase
LVEAILQAPQKNEADIYEQRERVRALREKLKTIPSPEAHHLEQLADFLVKKSVWIVGGDGWAFDIGYGGLDHIMASGMDVNVLVLDTGVYSNTGGQKSKATPRGAVAKFAAGGKDSARKDLGLIAMSYGNVYVAQIAMGARDDQSLRAMVEAESFDGPSLIIAYSHCIAHGINMKTGFESQKAAVASGNWLLYRHDPRRLARGEKALVVDSKLPSMKVEDYLLRENRFKMLTKSNPEEAKTLWAQAQKDAEARWKFYEYMANRPGEPLPAATPAATPSAPVPGSSPEVKS